MQSLGCGFPKKEALNYLSNFKRFSEINILASKQLRDNRLGIKGVPERLRKIADEYLISKGIDQKVLPISIIDAKFSDAVKKIKRKKTKAAEVEHAIRHFINEKYNEYPVLYAEFSEMLTFLCYISLWKFKYKEVIFRITQLSIRKSLNLIVSMLFS